MVRIVSSFGKKRFLAYCAKIENSPVLKKFLKKWRKIPFSWLSLFFVIQKIESIIWLQRSRMTTIKDFFSIFWRTLRYKSGVIPDIHSAQLLAA